MVFLLAISKKIASNKTLQAVADKIGELIDNVVGPVLTVIGAAGVIYAIVLGVNYIKAETPDKRKEAQSRLINAVIGIVIIIAGIVLVDSINWSNLGEDIGSFFSSSSTTT